MDVLGFSRIRFNHDQKAFYCLFASQWNYSSASAFSVENGSATGKVPESAMTTSLLGLSRPSVLPCSILRTMLIPLIIFPNTTWRPSSQVVCLVVMKNCDPLVSLPARRSKQREEESENLCWTAIERSSCYLRWPCSTIRFRSASAWSFHPRSALRRWSVRRFRLPWWNHRLRIFFNYHSGRVKGKEHRPWIMKSFITRWNLLPLYPSPSGFSASSLKFWTVLGTVPPKRPISMRPSASPPIVMSK